MKPEMLEEVFNQWIVIVNTGVDLIKTIQSVKELVEELMKDI